MYISEIALLDVRRFNKLKIEVNHRGGSVLIAGDNGAGKTTILRSIAMGLCDVTSAAGLLRELPGSFVRSGERKAIIDLTLEDRKSRMYRTSCMADQDHAASNKQLPKGSVHCDDTFAVGAVRL